MIGGSEEDNNNGDSSEDQHEVTHMVDNESCVSIVESLNNEV